MVKKDGKFYVIDRIYGIKLIEVVFVGEEDRPLYKIYEGKECVERWRSKENLHEMTDYEIVDSDTYNRYLNYVEDNASEVIDYDMFGLPENSLIGTNKGNKEITKSNNTSNVKYNNIFNPVYGSNSNYSAYPSFYRNYEPPKKKTGFYDELTKSNTLVFHRTDPTTTMLDQIYEGKGWDVIHSAYDLDQEELFRVVDAHERIVCLGHGYPGGLMGMFGPEMAPHLKDKKLFIIWCNADKYFDNAHIGDGQFITGNMPSEVGESIAAGCGNIGKQEMLDNITYWSKLCADVVERCLDGDVASSVAYIRENYIAHYGTHPVTKYNAIRTKVHGTSYPQNEKEVDDIYNRLGIQVKPVDDSVVSGGWNRTSLWGDED